jgi:hypothetical protein
MGIVKVVMTSHGRGEVFVDGVKVKGVYAVRFSGETDCSNKVIIELKPSKVEIECAEADIESKEYEWPKP